MYNSERVFGISMNFIKQCGDELSSIFLSLLSLDQRVFFPHKLRKVSLLIFEIGSKSK